MLRRSAALAAVLLACAARARAEELRPQDPRLSVIEGRAILVQRGTRGTVLHPGVEHGVRDDAHLRVVAGARARLAWPGIASLDIRGPSELSWRELAVGEGALADPRSLDWSLHAVGELELELRRSGPRLELPGGWTATPGIGAYRLEGAPAGRVRLAVRAGDALVLEYRDPTGRVRPPGRIGPGDTVDLSPSLLPRSRRDLSAEARPWRDDLVRWPWGVRPLERHTPREPVTDAAVPPPTPRVALEPLPTRAVETSHAVIDSPRIALEPAASEPPPCIALPAATYVAPEPQAARLETLPRTAVEPLPPLASPSAAASAAVARPFEPAHWRGLRRDELERLPFGLLQLGEGVGWEPLEAGAWRVELDARAPRTALVFLDALDLVLRPATSVTIGADGRVAGFQGPIEILPPVPGRPRPAELLEEPTSELAR